MLLLRVTVFCVSAALRSRCFARAATLSCMLRTQLMRLAAVPSFAGLARLTFYP